MEFDFGGLSSYIVTIFVLHFLFKIIYSISVSDTDRIRKIEWIIDISSLILMFLTFTLLGNFFIFLDLDAFVFRVLIGVTLIVVPILFSILKYFLYRKYRIQGNGYNEIILNIGYWLFLIILSIIITSNL